MNIAIASTTCSLIEVRNNGGQMVMLGAMADVREIGGPIAITRYNLYTAAPVNGTAPPDISTGETIRVVDRLADQTLPLTMSTEWTELMLLQILAGNTTLAVFSLAVLSVFLTLAALYENWSLPLAVILVVPLCLLCSVAGVLFTHRDVNIFVQIGLVVLVGPGLQERDPGRRVCPAVVAGRPGRRGDRHTDDCVRRHGRGSTAAAAADLDDVVRLCVRRSADGPRRRCRGRRCADRWGRPFSAACSA